MNPKKGEIKTYEQLQEWGVEREYAKQLKEKVKILGNRVCNLRAQGPAAKDSYGMTYNDYQMLIYAVRFGNFKDDPKKGLNEVASYFKVVK